MKRKVFITGVAGFLGSHLADKFIASGWDVSGCDNLLGGYPDNIPTQVDFHQVDCNDLEPLTKAMEGSNILYHCAATAYEGLSVFSPSIVTKHIVGASVGAFTAAIKVGCERIIHCSSMARYGTNQVPFQETYTPFPQDPYGIGKVAAEEMLKNLCDVHGLDWVIAVPHNIIGPRQKYDDPYRNVASIMINLMLQDRQPVIYGTGEQMRCFSFVQDDIPILEKFATEDCVLSETINIGPDKEFVTINQLAQIIADLLNFKLDPIRMPGRPQEVFLANCSANKARKLLGYEPTWSLRDGLQEMINYIKEKGVKPFNYHLPVEIISNKTPKTWTKKIF